MAPSQSTPQHAVIPLSPIIQLPSELLAQIFDLHWLSFTPAFEDIAGLTCASSQTEICRLAHAPLLSLSQVCSRWHTIALGTPSLWREIQLDNVLWDTSESSHIDKVLELLESALARGRNSSLTVMMICDVDKPPFYPALQLLTAHSERWQIASLKCPMTVIDAFSGVKGRLPRLENLELEIWDDESRELDILEVVPRLERLAFGGPLVAISKLPIGQLNSFSCLDMLSVEAPMVMSVMTQLKRSAEFRLDLEIWHEDPSQVFDVNIPPLTSNISSITIEVLETFIPAQCRHTLGEIFANLTLPALEDLKLKSEQYPHLPLPWPHNDFLSLCARSSFHIHLRSLQLHHVIVTEGELLECLSNLPSLERLTISDHQAVGDKGADQLLITDTLLTALTPKLNKADLVPLLRYLECSSLLQFDDQVFLKFLSSRSAGCRNTTTDPFQSAMFWLHGHRRALKPDVISQITDLRARKELVFLFCSQRRALKYKG
ncbi:hypothetical protein FB451DRAFT_1207955 [Mycena latifolia]|nr:hypothetical protein FB451DRAFT_1207955 [Mycena latifolia]